MSADSPRPSARLRACNNDRMPASPSRVVIVGGGPGGYEGGLVAAQLGAEVTLVDSDGVGGSAVLTDCVPSKTLIATAELMTEVEGAGELGVGLTDHEGDEATTVSVDLARVNARVKQLGPGPERRHRAPAREGRRAGRRGPRSARRAATPWSWTPSDGEERLAADAVLLATGAAPRITARARSPTASGSSPGSRSTTSPSCPTHLIVVGSGVTAPSSPAPTSRSAPRSPWSRAATGCCPARTPTPRRCSRTCSPGAGCTCWSSSRMASVDPRRGHRDRDAHRRPHGRGLPLHPGRRLGPQHRRARARDGRRGHRRARVRRRSTGSRGPPPAGCTPPATAPAS